MFTNPAWFLWRVFLPGRSIRLMFHTCPSLNKHQNTHIPGPSNGPTKLSNGSSGQLLCPNRMFQVAVSCTFETKSPKAPLPDSLLPKSLTVSGPAQLGVQAIFAWMRSTSPWPSLVETNRTEVSEGNSSGMGLTWGMGHWHETTCDMAVHVTCHLLNANNNIIQDTSGYPINDMASKQSSGTNRYALARQTCHHSVSI